MMTSMSRSKANLRMYRAKNRCLLSCNMKYRGCMESFRLLTRSCNHIRFVLPLLAQAHCVQQFGAASIRGQRSSVISGTADAAQADSFGGSAVRF